MKHDMLARTSAEPPPLLRFSPALPLLRRRRPPLLPSPRRLSNGASLSRLESPTPQSRSRLHHPTRNPEVQMTLTEPPATAYTPLNRANQPAQPTHAPPIRATLARKWPRGAPAAPRPSQPPRPAHCHFLWGPGQIPHIAYADPHAPASRTLRPGFRVGIGCGLRQPQFYNCHPPSPGCPPFL
jgi:hypothetical protein